MQGAKALHRGPGAYDFFIVQAGPPLLVPDNELSQDIGTYRERIVLVDRIFLFSSTCLLSSDKRLDSLPCVTKHCTL